ncbi:hypothetical protein GCM10009000_056140 [Halobacterium noricense]
MFLVLVDAEYYVVHTANHSRTGISPFAAGDAAPPKLAVARAVGDRQPSTARVGADSLVDRGRVVDPP